VKIRDVAGAEPVEGTHQVVKITVTGAHTYVSNDILSHNIKSQQTNDT
jgi:intein/homing endonuclease